MTGQRHKRYADMVVSVHFFWTFLLIAGVVAMFVYPLYAGIQILVMSFTLLIALPFRNTCPLTLLEENLRRNYDPTYRNHGSYIAVYINKIFKTNFTAAQVNTFTAALYILAYAAAITILIVRDTIMQ